jgi:hypothetical protein
MREWRKLRLWRIHLLTWLVIGGGAMAGLEAQHCDDGWPMQCRIPDDPGILAGQPSGNYLILWPGLIFNIAFFAAITLSTASVVERLIGSWRKPWQVSLAGALWASSLFGTTLAVTQQEYLPIMMTAFGYLRLTPRSEECLPGYIRLPIYLGIGCLLYVLASALGTAAIAAVRRWRGNATASIPE